MKASTDGSTRSFSTSTGQVIIRRPRLNLAPPPLPTTPTLAELRTEFHDLRHQLPGTDPLERARLIARLNEIIRLQKAMETHADFFLPERMRLPDETVH